MALRTNKIYPLSGEAGHGGGIIQVKFATREGEVTFSSDSVSTYKTVLTCSITPQSSSNKIFIHASADGIANRSGNGEWEAWLGSGANATSNGSDPTSWTTLAMITGLGAWVNDGGQQTIGTYAVNYLDEPSTTSTINYSIICNRKTSSTWNSEFTGSNPRGTSITLWEVAS